GAPGGGLERGNLPFDPVRACRPAHRAADLRQVLVRDRDYAASRSAERGPQGSSLLGRRDGVVEIGIGAGATRLVQAVVHRARDQGAISSGTGELPLGDPAEVEDGVLARRAVWHQAAGFMGGGDLVRYEDYGPPP